MKFRDLVHTQDQAGIPANLRAIEQEAPKTTPTSRGNQGVTKHDMERRIKKIVRYLQEHGGRAAPNDLLQLLGFTKTAQIAWTILRMEKLGLIRRVGSVTDRVYVLREQRTDLPKGDKLNGPVTSYTSPVPTTDDREPSVVETQAEAAIPQLTQETKEETKVTFSPEYARFDQLIWEYVKEHEATAPVMIKLTKWIREHI
jgi:hypothetical protein